MTIVEANLFNPFQYRSPNQILTVLDVGFDDHIDDVSLRRVCQYGLYFDHHRFCCYLSILDLLCDINVVLPKSQ